MADDPERLIAEALRAQAARTPLPAADPDGATQFNAAPGLGLAGSGYGLLSGSDLALSLPTRPAPVARVDGATTRLEPHGPAPVLAILLLAAMLGLAAGAVIGLLTLL